ncbi:hypothetical protein [Nocardioides luteus]|uniref:hypothetical protein n=1 Tax=Nocardioides luteus TaxID=1844 RepID=UPI001E41EA1D|nr:hypothetical protein [Nocardioides luteus]
MERVIDFWRDRHMLCPTCRHRWIVDLDWIDRWEQAQEACPGCGLTCEHEDAPRVTVDPGDPALQDRRVAQLDWYHTSTHQDWPRRDFDPAAALDPETRARMGGDHRVAAWAARQRAKALHVGTYESAIHNMLRRIRDQADHGSQFHLYRVHLVPTVTVRQDWVSDPSNWVGDVDLDTVCPPGVDIARYLNYHEDPGGLSLALGRGAIACVQEVAIPMAEVGDANWIQDAVDTLNHAAKAKVSIARPTRGLGRLRPPPSPQVIAARDLAKALADRLPINLRWQFTSATAFADGDDPVRWARQTSGLRELIKDPAQVLAALDSQECRQVSLRG